MIHIVEVHAAERIGRELLEIESAIDHLGTAFGNRHLSEDHRSMFFESPLFEALSERREELRDELLEINKTLF